VWCADIGDIDRADPNLQPPRVPGHEVVGHIAAIGTQVPAIWTLGERVGVGRLGGPCGVCAQCRQGQFQLCQNQPSVGSTTANKTGTRLTVAGAVFLQDMRRLFTLLEHARENTKAVAAGLRGSVHIAISDNAIDGRLPIFLARCREEAPDIELQVCEVTLSEQLRGLRDGDFIFGLTHTADVGGGVVAEPL